MVLLGVAVWFGIRWLSIRAKPLGPKPSRWATSIAITLAAWPQGRQATSKTYNGLPISSPLEGLEPAFATEWFLLRGQIPYAVAGTSSASGPGPRRVPGPHPGS